MAAIIVAIGAIHPAMSLRALLLPDQIRTLRQARTHQLRNRPSETGSVSPFDAPHSHQKTVTGIDRFAARGEPRAPRRVSLP